MWAPPGGDLRSVSETLRAERVAGESGWQKSAICLTVSARERGPPGDRTRDTVIKSHVLYH